MTRGEMRTVYRRRMQDTADTPEVADADVNSLLNLGLLEVQTRILEVDPLAFIAVDTFDQVVSQERYDKPAGFLYEQELAILDAAQASGWRPLARASYQRTRLKTAGSPLRYSSLGRFFYLTPIPSTSVNEGLRLTYVYALSMSADSDVPLVALPLHNAVVDEAVLLALAETSDEDATDRTTARLERTYKKLPTYYRPSRNPVGVTIMERDARRRQRLADDVYPR